MTDANYSEMDAEQLQAFLGNGGTGVLSFSTGDGETPHSIPVSYGFDPAESAFFFRLAVDPGGRKTDLMEDAHVSFVTHEVTDDEWRSVVATGQLDDVSEVDVASGVLESLRRVDIRLFDAFEDPTDDVSFRFVRLAPEEITGRTGG